MSEVSKSNKKRSVLQNIYIMLVISPLFGYLASLGLSLLMDVKFSSAAVTVVLTMTVMTLYVYKNLLFGTNPDGSIKRGKLFQAFTYIAIFVGGVLLFVLLHVMDRIIPISKFSFYLIFMLVLSHLVYLIIYLKLRSGLK